MANLADIPDHLMDLTMTKETMEYIEALPMALKHKLALYELWGKAVNHPATRTEYEYFHDTFTGATYGQE